MCQYLEIDLSLPPSQATAIQMPPVEELQQILPCLLDAAKLVYAYDQGTSMIKLMEAYTQMISNAVCLRGTLVKLERYGSTATEMLRKDKGFQVLGLLARSRKMHQNSKVLITNLISAIPDVVEDSDKARLLNLNMPNQFQVVERDANQMFSDLVAYQMSSFHESLKGMAAEMVGYLNGYHLHGETPWGANLGDDIPYEEVSTVGKETILKLDPAFRKLPDDFMQAGSGEPVVNRSLTFSQV